MTGAPTYRTEAEIKEVVKRFEECTYSPEEFAHAKHLTVAAWYFWRLEPETAREKMRMGLRKFIAHHGKHGYHVTITEFWLLLVERSVCQDHRDLLTAVNETVASFHNKDLVYEYFSRARLNSAEARTAWIEPDIKPIH
jgi:hypothetical protein